LIAVAYDREARMKRIVALIIAASLVPAAWAGNPFVGSWKLDPSRSRQMAERLHYIDLGDGRMRFSNGAAARYDFALDGEPHPTGEGRSVSWRRLGPGRWQTTNKVAGRTTETATRVLSADGNTLAVHARGTLPDGTAYTHDRRYSRVGSGQGLAGEWRGGAVDTNGMPDGYLISEDAAGVVTWEIPTDRQRLLGRFDGSDMVLAGPGVPAGTVFAMTRVSERRISYVMKTGGEPGQYGTATISKDGNTFTEESWLPGHEEDKSVGVLARYRCPPSGQPMPAGDPAWLCAQR
jgi:hypothetical protein